VKKQLNVRIQSEIDRQMSIQRSSEPGWRLWDQIREGIFHPGSSSESSEGGYVSDDSESNLTQK
jgi:hypothetical protein